MQTGFILDDLTLYLDMHKADSEALKMYVEKSQKLYELKKEFAQKFYPVTRDFMLYGVNDKEFGWMEGPMPWEGACI